MRTPDLIVRLVDDLAPVEQNVAGKRLCRALLAGLAGGTLLLVAVFGIASDMPEQILTAHFWMRLAFPLAVIAAALTLVERLARPGMAVKFAGLMTVLPIAAVALGAVCFLWATPAEFRLRLVPGGMISTTTVTDTVLLSLPSLATTLHAMKGLAPTRLSLAGAGAGLLAGAQGVLVSVLYCPDMPAFHWGILRVLAILMTATIGAALGPGYLRWCGRR